ncbi:MAG: hypothetical protein ABGW50_01635 [Thermococcus sp.]
MVAPTYPPLTGWDYVEAVEQAFYRFFELIDVAYGYDYGSAGTGVKELSAADVFYFASKPSAIYSIAAPELFYTKELSAKESEVTDTLYFYEKTAFILKYIADKLSALEYMLPLRIPVTDIIDVLFMAAETAWSYGADTFSAFETTWRISSDAAKLYGRADSIFIPTMMNALANDLVYYRAVQLYRTFNAVEITWRFAKDLIAAVELLLLKLIAQQAVLAHDLVTLRYFYESDLFRGLDAIFKSSKDFFYHIEDARVIALLQDIAEAADRIAARYFELFMIVLSDEYVPFVVKQLRDTAKAQDMRTTAKMAPPSLIDIRVCIEHAPEVIRAKKEELLAVFRNMKFVGYADILKADYWQTMIKAIYTMFDMVECIMMIVALIGVPVLWDVSLAYSVLKNILWEEEKGTCPWR